MLTVILAAALAFQPMVSFVALDEGGRPIPNASICVFADGTTRPETSWRTPETTGPRAVVNTNPVLTDSHGIAAIYLREGRSYRLVLLAAGGVESGPRCADLERERKAGRIVREWHHVTYRRPIHPLTARSR